VRKDKEFCVATKVGAFTMLTVTGMVANNVAPLYLRVTLHVTLGVPEAVAAEALTPKVSGSGTEALAWLVVTTVRYGEHPAGVVTV
jgi:hypothetical protein